MKKSKILIAVFAVLTAASAVKADEITLDFDKPGRVSVNTYIMDKIIMDGSTAQKTPTPRFATELAGSEQPSSYINRLILVKDILNEFTPKDRVAFVSSISLADGKVASQGYALLELTGLPVSKVDEIIMAFETAAGHNSFKPEVQRPGTELGDILQGLPEDIKEDFADNLKFLNGSVVSAKTDLLESAVASVEFKEIVNALMPATQGVKDTKEIRKDEACNASTGAKGKV